ncbi:MAG: hypothetical protein LCH32_08335 [Bacteroidetes bacterium]|nr:hypothetical protein [Bacteroidota bacterium]
MRNILIIFILIVFTTCRKKSDITITAWNYAMAEPITNAEVAIFEVKYKGGLFSAGTECKEIAHATTDANGQCFFSNLKLNKNNGLQYAAKVKYSYGKADFYNCNVTENSEVKVLNKNDLTLNSSDYDAFIKFQFNNILNPSISGDSIWFSSKTRAYNLPEKPYPYGGGGLLNTFYKYNGNNYPSVITTNILKTYAGKIPIYIYKKKMGIVSQTIDTIKIYPYETKTIEINW